MNCRPGDLAIIVHPSMYGTLVQILYAEPDGNYTLPDGFPGRNVDGPGWVFEFLGAPRSVPVGRRSRTARYAACNDRWLRPIRDHGDDAQDEVLRPLPTEAEHA